MYMHTNTRALSRIPMYTYMYIYMYMRTQCDAYAPFIHTCRALFHATLLLFSQTVAPHRQDTRSVLSMRCIRGGMCMHTYCLCMPGLSAVHTLA